MSRRLFPGDYIRPPDSFAAQVIEAFQTFFPCQHVRVVQFSQQVVTGWIDGYFHGLLKRG